jgi:hypothetical protein
MADDHGHTGPSLEPPSLFRRKKRSPATPAAQPAGTPPAPPADESPTTILDDVPTFGAPGPKPTAPPLFADEAPAASSDPIVSPNDPEPNTSRSLDAPAPTRKASRPPRQPRGTPLVPGRVAAAVVGLLVGGIVVGLTYASFGLCEEVRGTNSCGGPGFFLLVAILVAAVLVGALVLRLCRVPDPGSTSFLAVGLTSVIALLFLVDALFEWWMLIVIPLVSILTFLLAHWVTTTFVEPARPVGLADDPEVVDHDVR